MTLRRLKLLTSAITSADATSQKNKVWTGTKEYGELAYLLIQMLDESNINPHLSKNINLLALAVHHGAPRHSLRQTSHILWRHRSYKKADIQRQQLVDRVRIMNHQLQIYGTQYKVDKTTGKWTPFAGVE